MSGLTDTEINNLSVMYTGDKNRDASSKIRGFLFQDYVAVKSLLQEQVVSVCSEYLEDVDVFFEDGTFEFIQVKYYPKKDPSSKRKEIFTDLYYQFLRLQVLQSSLKAHPRLYIHSKTMVDDPTLEEMKNYIGLDSLPKSVNYAAIAAPADWLSDNVYIKQKKEEQKAELFLKMASEQSLQEFVAVCNIIPQKNINCYKKELLEELVNLYPMGDKSGKREEWQTILLGCAMMYIQQRYQDEDTDFENLRMDKKEFDQYMTKLAGTKTEQTIVNYLAGLVCEVYGSVVEHNELSDLQENMLNQIYQKTLCWISKVAETVEGQYQILNTCSMDEEETVTAYKTESIADRLLDMAECKMSISSFLKYLWKIMLNICQEKISDAKNLPEHLKLLDPDSYIDCSVKNYICLNFPDDIYARHSVIVPPAVGDFTGMKRKVIGRMIHISPRPEKWFFQNYSITKGKNYYDYSTASVIENPTVADLGDASFYIECMECIEIEETKWSKPEHCNECIFAEKCIKEVKAL